MIGLCFRIEPPRQRLNLALGEVERGGGRGSGVGLREGWGGGEGGSELSIGQIEVTRLVVPEDWSCRIFTLVKALGRSE